MKMIRKLLTILFVAATVSGSINAMQKNEIIELNKLEAFFKVREKDPIIERIVEPVFIHLPWEYLPVRDDIRNFISDFHKRTNDKCSTQKIYEISLKKTKETQYIIPKIKLHNEKKRYEKSPTNAIVFIKQDKLAKKRRRLSTKKKTPTFYQKKDADLLPLKKIYSQKRKTNA